MASIPVSESDDLAAFSRLETIYGLVEIDSLSPDPHLKESFRTKDDRINAFKRQIIGDIAQPDFFISKGSWKRLLNGLNERGTCWLPCGFEVFGLAFCLAFKKQISAYHAYFRIRTIIKNKDDGEIKIERDNIAYVDLEFADRFPTKNCLRFITPSTKNPLSLNILNVVNEDVMNYKNQIFEKPLEQTPVTNIDEILKAKKENPQKPESWNEIAKIQEGCVFLKNSPYLNHLWESGSTGSKISIAWTEKTQLVSFVFSINPYGETQGLPCPVPVVACSNS